MKARQFLRKLRARGATVDAGRGKGGHVYVRYGDRKSIVKMHGSKDLDNRYVKLVCAQLGIDPEDL